MRNRLYLSLSVVALVCLVGWTVHAQLQRTAPVRQAWEYKFIYLAREQKSNTEWTAWLDGSADGVKRLPSSVQMHLKAKELGDQGWELVSVTPVSGATGGSSICATDVRGCYSDYAGFTDGLEYWFKRPK